MRHINKNILNHRIRKFQTKHSVTSIIECDHKVTMCFFLSKRCFQISGNASRGGKPRGRGEGEGEREGGGGPYRIVETLMN